MCETVDFRRQTGQNILIEFERDAPIRATEVLVINQDRDGHEREGVKMICYDNGKIVVGKSVKVMDGVDILI